MTEFRHQEVAAKDVNIIYGEPPQQAPTAELVAPSPVVILVDGGLPVGGQRVGSDVYVGDDAAQKLTKCGHVVQRWEQGGPSRRDTQ